MVVAVRERVFGIDAIVRIARRNRETKIAASHRHRTLGRFLFGEHQADLGAVFSLFAVGGVVDLKDQIRSRLESSYQVPAATSRAPCRACRSSGRHCPRRRYFGSCPPGGTNGTLVLALRSHLEAGSPDEDHDVVDNRPVARARFGHLHPFVFGEFRGQDNILIRHFALGRQMERFRHVQHHVGLLDIPAVDERERFGRILEIAFLGAAVHPGNQRCAISPALSERSFEKCPYFGSANQGGIFLVSTSARIDLAHGRASLKVSSEKGAISPGRWHSWQCFWTIGSTSLWNVTEVEVVAAKMNEDARKNNAECFVIS